MAMKTTFTSFAVFVLTGCAGMGLTPQTLTVSTAPADAGTATAMLEPGDGRITGSALLRQRGGGVVTCAGNEVFLVPSTPSVSAELERIFGGEEGYRPHGGYSTGIGGTMVAPPEPNRRSICNPQGSFVFNNVGAGRWHVITTVIWEAGSAYQGGTLLGTTQIAEGEEAELVLTQ
jgi:hypothetical protein